MCWQPVPISTTYLGHSVRNHKHNDEPPVRYGLVDFHLFVVLVLDIIALAESHASKCALHLRPVPEQYVNKLECSVSDEKCELKAVSHMLRAPDSTQVGTKPRDDLCQF